MEKIGVAAVVEGLSGFLGSMDKMDNSIRKLISPTNILGTVFGSLGKVLTGIGSFITNTLAHALGELLADAVQWVTSQIGELVHASIQAADEFQHLQVRLDRLNFNELKHGGAIMANALEKSIAMTREQLIWTQKLGAQTPFDPVQIANIYTLARGYGFASDEAKGLVESITDFAAGMGLSEEHIERIIINFGQMKAQGKITGTELKDLARGAFVPVNDLLKRIAENLGVNADKFADLASRKKVMKALYNDLATSVGLTSQELIELSESGQVTSTQLGIMSHATGVATEDLRTMLGVGKSAASLFFKEFQKMVGEDFAGSAEAMNDILSESIDNLKEMVNTFLGFNIVLPIFESLSERVVAFQKAIFARWDQIFPITEKIGKTLSEIITEVLGVLPSVDGLADAVVVALQGVSDWLDEHRDDIVAFAENAIKGFQEDLLPAIQQVWGFLFGTSEKEGAIQKFGAWLKNDLVPFIQNQVIPGVEDLLDLVTGKKKEGNLTDRGGGSQKGAQDVSETPLQNVVTGIGSLATALPSVVELLSAIGEVIIVAFGGDETQSFSEFVTNTLIPGIETLTKVINENQEKFALLFKVIIALEVIGFIVGLVLSLVTGLIALGLAIVIVGAGATDIYLLVTAFTVMKNTLIANLSIIFASFIAFKENIRKTFEDVRNLITKGDWVGAGMAIIQGIARGIMMMQGTILALASQLAQRALNAFRSIFQIHSPSAEMFDIGQQIVTGLAKGVQESSKMAVNQMSKTASAMLAAATPRMAYSAALTGPSQNTYQTNNAFNLNVNSSARTEPLISDFGMMQSLVSG